MNLSMRGSNRDHFDLWKMHEYVRQARCKQMPRIFLFRLFNYLAARKLRLDASLGKFLKLRRSQNILPIWTCFGAFHNLMYGAIQERIERGNIGNRKKI